MDLSGQHLYIPAPWIRLYGIPLLILRKRLRFGLLMRLRGVFGLVGHGCWLVKVQHPVLVEGVRGVRISDRPAGAALPADHPDRQRERRAGQEGRREHRDPREQEPDEQPLAP